MFLSDCIAWQAHAEGVEGCLSPFAQSALFDAQCALFYEWTKVEKMEFISKLTHFLLFKVSTVKVSY